MMRGRFPILQIFMLSACVCGLKSLLSDEVFWVCSGGFQRPFGHSTASLLCSAPPATQSQRFVDMFAKHKQLGLQRNLSLFWGKKSRGGWVYSQFAAVSVSGRAGKAGLKEGKLLLVWVNHLVQRSPGLQWHERSWKSQSTCWLAGLIGESSSLLGVNKQ